MAEITREQIEELRGLLPRATQAPWAVRYSPRNEEDCVVVGQKPPSMAYAPCILADDYNGFGGWPVREADHLLVAAMRNALPALLDIAETAIRNLEQAKGGDANADPAGSNPNTKSIPATSPGRECEPAGASVIEELCKRLEDDASDYADAGFKHGESPSMDNQREAATLIRRLVAERDDAHAEAYTTDEDGQSVTWRELCEAERSIRQFQQRRATDAEAEVERLRAENAELKAWKKRRQEEDEDEADRREIW